MAHFCNPEKEGQEVERVPSGFGAPKKVDVSSHGYFTAGGSPTQKGRFSHLRGSGLSAAPAGQPITKVILTVYVGTASMRGAF